MQNIELKNKTILVTGAAGFIGANLVTKLIDKKEPMTIIGLDNVNDYYDVSIKHFRLEEIEKLVAQLEAEGIDKEDEAPAIAEVPEEDKAIVKELEAKVKDLEKELANKDKEISKKSSQIKDKDAEISDLNENLIPKLKAESANLKKELKEVKAEFDESESNVRGQIVKLEANIKDLEGKLDNKTRDYNKLSTTINNKDKEIKSLKNRNKELSESLDASFTLFSR